jgi:hypothetical protein
MRAFGPGAQPPRLPRLDAVTYVVGGRVPLRSGRPAHEQAHLADNAAFCSEPLAGRGVRAAQVCEGA